MIRTALVVAIVGLCVNRAAAQDRFPQFEKRTFRDGDKQLPYRLLVPKAYAPGIACPLVVWLHGSGEKGGDNVAPLRAALDKTFLADAETCPAFVLVPQCPSGKAWHAVGLNKPPEVTEPSRLVVRAIAAVHKEVGLDGRSSYLGASSAVESGSWDFY